jgi:two-component system, OmpR family, phosphate regulon sensor histidine kinase PhoR
LRLRLFWKLGLSYLALLLLALTAVYVETSRIWGENFLESTYRHLESLVRVGEGSPPNVTDLESLSDWARWLSGSGARVTVVASDGTVLADSDEVPARMANHSGRPEIREAFIAGRGRSSRFSETIHTNLVYLAVREPWGPGPPVVLRLSEPLGRVNEAMAEVRAPLLTLSLLTLVVGGLSSFLVSRSFSTRVRRLEAFSHRVAAGDFSPAPVANRRDELDDLQVSLNETVLRLSESMSSLAQERNQSAAILSSMSEGVAVVDEEERILYSNPAFRRALQASRAASSEGRRLVEVTRETEILAMVQEVLGKGERMEAEIATAGLKPRHFLVRAAPVGDVERAGAVLVVLDITEIRRLERVRRDFVANVSHELRTPLTAIQGFAETLLRGALEEPENNRRFVEIIRDHAARLARLTEDLLKLSRIEAGKLEIELRPISVRVVIDACADTVRLKVNEKRQTLTVLVDEPSPVAMADSHALADVLRNLLDNAIQYTPDDGNIEIRVSAAADEVWIAVRDDGIGIPSTSHDRIFERFYRVDAARSRKVGGTGLGLSISRHLVEAMGGRIKLESQLGKGSTFTVCLPLERRKETEGHQGVTAY